MELPPCREQGPILMIRPRRLPDPMRFQDTMRGIPVALPGAPVEALVDGCFSAATRAVDTIAPKHPLRSRARPGPWYTQDLRTMKRIRRRLECIWRRTPTDYNKIAVRIATNSYLAKVKAARRSHVADWISEASNQQAELFRIVCDLSGISLSDRPPTSISLEQFAAF